MNTRLSLVLVLAGAVVGCGRAPLSPTALASSADAADQAAALASAASGTFTQTALTSVDARSAGPNTVIDQTGEGTITGTLSGPFQDELKVVIHQNGSFTAKFTITCQCTVDGKQGVVEMVATDRGQMVAPTLASFSGRVVITNASGGLVGLRGVLPIEGTVDLTTGLATYDYDGTIRFTR